MVWLNVGLLCRREHLSPWRHAPILKKKEQFTLQFNDHTTHTKLLNTIYWISTLIDIIFFKSVNRNARCYVLRNFMQRNKPLQICSEKIFTLRKPTSHNATSRYRYVQWTFPRYVHQLRHFVLWIFMPCTTLHVFQLIDAFGYGRQKRIGCMNVKTSLVTFRGHTGARQGWSLDVHVRRRIKCVSATYSKSILKYEKWSWHCLNLADIWLCAASIS